MPAATDTRKKTMYHKQAWHIACRLVERFAPLCQTGKCVIAGSLRRQKEKVNDIEIVCIPKYGHVQMPGELFRTEQNLVVHHLTISGDIQITKGGPRYHQIIFEDTQVDLFMTAPDQWGRMLAVRTGPADYSIKLASRWKALGYMGHKGELVSIKGSRYKPEFPTEKSFFEFLGWEYPQPSERG